MDPDEGRGGVSSSNNNGRYSVARPSSPTQSHSHSQAQSREVLSDSSTPIAENWCVTKVIDNCAIFQNLPFQCLGECPKVFVHVDYS